MGLFDDRKVVNGKTSVPVWFMRQAGRYHSHYQNIKKNSDFMSMCKSPKLACEVTLGPIEEFSFDAAILFSDLLFPLEHLNMGLSYASGPPTLGHKISEGIDKISPIAPATEFYSFQKDALILLKESLPQGTTLLGFVGAPFTLYAYACEGGHAGNLIASKKGLYDGLWSKFMEQLLPSVQTEMEVQAEGGADAICLFDTAAGELSIRDYLTFALPEIKKLTSSFKKKYPNKKIIYYSKHTNLDYLERIEDSNIDVLGIDWRLDINKVMKSLQKDYYIQGNIDPSWLHLPWNELQKNLSTFWQSFDKIDYDKWICGLGHGVLPATPQENVKRAVEFIHENFLY